MSRDPQFDPGCPRCTLGGTWDGARVGTAGVHRSGVPSAGAGTGNRTRGGGVAAQGWSWIQDECPELVSGAGLGQVGAAQGWDWGVWDLDQDQDRDHRGAQDPKGG